MDLFVQAAILNSFILIGIYAFRGFEYNNGSNLNSSIVTFGAGTLAGTLVAFIPILIFYDPRISQNHIILTVVVSCFLNPVIFSLYMKAYIKSLPKTKVLIIGNLEEIEPIIKEIEEKSLGKICAYKYIDPSVMTLERDIDEQSGFSEVLITNPNLEKNILAQVENVKQKGIKVHYLPKIAEEYLQRIPIQVAVNFKEYYRIAFDGIKESPSKRVLDVIIAILAFIILSPVMCIFALGIYLEDGKPIVFKQERIGQDGKRFIMHKFRTMKNESESTAKFVTDEQHRILKIGKIMRPVRLDEIPQFWDILTGKMSFIGPRPEQPHFVEEYKDNIPFYFERHRLKSGLTGWAQITYQYASNMEETAKKLSYDLFYIKNRNTVFDLRIILQTLETVLWKRGAK